MIATGSREHIEEGGQGRVSQGRVWEDIVWGIQRREKGEAEGFFFLFPECFLVIFVFVLLLVVVWF